MRRPLSTLEKELAAMQIRTAEERDLLRRALARAVKALDQKDPTQARTILFSYL